MPENKYNNIRPSGSGTQETKNINSTYNPASSTDRNWNPSRSCVEGSVTRANGLEQHEFTGLTQSDIEMRDHQFDTNEEDVSRQIDSGLEVGSMVEVPIMQGKGTQYGVIRWIGQLPELPGKIVAGLELVSILILCNRAEGKMAKKSLGLGRNNGKIWSEGRASIKRESRENHYYPIKLVFY